MYLKTIITFFIIVLFISCGSDGSEDNLSKISTAPVKGTIIFQTNGYKVTNKKAIQLLSGIVESAKDKVIYITACSDNVPVDDKLASSGVTNSDFAVRRYNSIEQIIVDIASQKKITVTVLPHYTKQNVPAGDPIVSDIIVINGDRVGRVNLDYFVLSQYRNQNMMVNAN